MFFIKNKEGFGLSLTDDHDFTNFSISAVEISSGPNEINTCWHLFTVQILCVPSCCSSVWCCAIDKISCEVRNFHIRIITNSLNAYWPKIIRFYRIRKNLYTRILWVFVGCIRSEGHKSFIGYNIQFACFLIQLKVKNGIGDDGWIIGCILLKDFWFIIGF